MSDTPGGPSEGGPTDPSPTAPYDPPTASDAPPPTPPTTAPPPPAPAVATPLAPPPPVRPRDDGGRTGTIVFGLILLAVGLWFFADQTLGLEMPRLSWSELWPLIIIVLGGWILVASMRRR
jgi:LiaI-LiaF-like transmembrane region